MSKLYFRYSAMNAGKTTQLLQVAHNYEERGMNVLILKPSIDTKSNSSIESRLGIKREVDIIINRDTNMGYLIAAYETYEEEKDISCILVDEAQFLTTEQVDDLLDIAAIGGIPVICYGLRTDFTGKGFEGSRRLLEVADDIEELKTICKCGKKATFNLRRVNGIPITEGNQVEIDNQDEIEYESMCYKCYSEATLKKDLMINVELYNPFDGVVL